MSRSYKKTPIFGNTTTCSEKSDKKIAHGKFRAKLRDCLKQHRFDECPIDMNEVSNIWDFGKDGKHYWIDAPEKYMRK